MAPCPARAHICSMISSKLDQEGGSERAEKQGPIPLVGEHLFAVERLVVSPAAGVFEPLAGVADGAHVEVGTVLGHIGETEVRSAFAGVLQSYIAVSGERVTHRQPIAWLRTA